MRRPPIVIICGSTGSGKSMLGLELAEALKGEIVGADSMQVYINMDIGTDKSPVEIRQRIGHHVIDLVYPDQPFDAIHYREAASRAIERISDSGKRVFVVGGTGLYIRALTHGLFPCPPIPEEIRTKLREEARQKGLSHLYDELRRVDGAAASRIHRNDSVRIVRALEVYRATGKPISEFRRTHQFSQQSYEVLKLALEVERRELYRRIDDRVDQMIERGLIEEVERLFNLGYGRDLRPMQAIGYRQVAAYLHGDLSLKRAIELIKRDTRRYAKRQWTWFKGDSAVCWVTGRSPEDEAFRKVKNFLKV